MTTFLLCNELLKNLVTNNNKTWVVHMRTNVEKSSLFTSV